MDAVEFMALSDSKAPPPKLKPGDVWGIRGLTLQIGAGPDRSSLLSEKTETSTSSTTRSLSWFRLL
jgi:hypothetical protein